MELTNEEEQILELLVSDNIELAEQLAISQEIDIDELINDNILNCNSLKQFKASWNLNNQIENKTITTLKWLNRRLNAIKFVNCSFKNNVVLPEHLTDCQFDRTDVQNLILHNKLKRLKIEHYDISQYKLKLYDGLEELRLDYCNLVELPKLPDSLKVLSCMDNKLTFLPEHLPANLTYLGCSHNQLEKIPDNLPKNLEILHCNQNNIKDISNCNLKSLTRLMIAFNKLSSLNSQIFDSEKLEVLWVNYNELEVLDIERLNNLKYLYCHNNNLIELNVSLENLKTLNCGNNKLQKLPDFEHSIIESLDCLNNPLNSLSKLPKRLHTLKADERFLKQLPQLISNDFKAFQLYLNN